MGTHIAQRIKDFNKDRLHQFLQLKYKLMAQNSFRFYRGSCHLFYDDLSKHKPFQSFPHTWICGDLHLENFGTFKGDNRLVYFDLNDFDEAILAPVSFEILRMLTSIFLGAQEVGLKLAQTRSIAKLFVDEYSTILAKGKPKYIELETARGIVRRFLLEVEQRKQKTLLNLKTIKKRNELFLLIDNKKSFALDKKLKKQILHHAQGWINKRKFSKYKHLARDAAYRVAGTGSLGLERFEILVEVRSATPKYFLLDMKEAKDSCISRRTRIKQPHWESQAERIIFTQELMQNVAPAVLTPVKFKRKSFVVKELQPVADKINLIGLNSLEEIQRVILDMALLSASAHLRSAGRKGSASADELIEFGKAKQWQKKFLQYSERYATQVKKDYQSFLKAYRSGFFK
ncbi:MAG: DUF2252 domain-containing protein [Bacteroidetes bacterium]|nr:MAG: DUF2252 domain-containing protein [Bacteroidota bacterium]